MGRKKFTWVSSRTGKKYRDICTVPKFVRMIACIIQTEEEAEDFMEKYSKVSSEAEHNVGYFAHLIHDPDIREDVLDLFMVDSQIEPRHILNKEYRFSSVLAK